MILLLLLLLLLRVSLLLQPTKRGRSMEHVVVMAWPGTYSDVAHNAFHFHPARPINTTSYVLEDDDGNDDDDDDDDDDEGHGHGDSDNGSMRLSADVRLYMPWWFSTLCAAGRLGRRRWPFQCHGPMSNTARIV
ncbi:hypothetical protein COCC4DRAFT_138407 [Bipolaris maydis ATCC 48331]|uniref:Secreted protein n=2 Tax=Cochliobolus heterostrophus TaxID=5016 RepID=M2TRQ7_COCH5|nr:uncharacterized protein COCC4DRAFT_138407 [Bipolaris maydis ATCC 48331]EMD89204.1 hypothetical protein COCHEDRAFT_1032272 [Bipolaris maydis C5]KAJ5024861.1 hypothetical protein J3E73DRAFT_397581 [Bipolaris maydis]ENI05078.1 hypothetical protein COCC4DRAFT_138407 [Bipolaris maydis ATCC 48331]KAJ5057077.1 hypothetical protein J3E74DRAFT_293510 [Bipolaris maydis]KAJ6212563.1 hypothetical protein PSV09DRAFT_1032272 [Bipolaris maydis]